MKLGAIRIALTMACGGILAIAPSIAEAKPAAAFSTYRAYTWIVPQASNDSGTETYQRVRASIDQMLTARGYRQEEPGDFAVAFTIDLRVHFDSGSDPSYALDRPLPVLNPALRKRVTEGVLKISIFDIATKERVWASKSSEEVAPGIENQGQIDRIVGKALERIPQAAN